MDNILDLIVDYSKRGKLIDLVFLKKIREIMIKEKSLEDYIGIIDFDPNLSDSYIKGCGGYYDFQTKDVAICEYTIGRIYELVKKGNKGRLSEYEEYILANSLEVQVVLHEFEHANQMRKIDFNNDFEALLLKASTSFELFYGNEILRGHPDEKLFYEYFKKKYYVNVPRERLAENYSRREIYDLMKPIFSDIHPQIDVYLNRCIDKTIIRGYSENNLEPTEGYLIDYDCFLFPEHNPLLDVEFYDVLASEKEKPLNDRLFFGLGITVDEFNKIKQKKR
ncbi:MAG: hypothetical protein HFH47_00730 [Bacilli bacterium]|nr:hypothetical protein [Bacilli bacterium]